MLPCSLSDYPGPGPAAPSELGSYPYLIWEQLERVGRTEKRGQSIVKVSVVTKINAEIVMYKGRKGSIRELIFIITAESQDNTDS